MEKQVENKNIDFIIPDFLKNGNIEENQVNELTKKISSYDTQINEMLDFIKPYMRIAKVNQEITKVINKNNMLDSITDYKKIASEKEKLVNYLEGATKFIKDALEKEEKRKQENKEDILKEFEQPVQEVKKTQEVPKGFWDEFDHPKERLTRPEKMKNADGTYTYEYMAYIASQTPGLEDIVLKQLEETNEEIRRKKEEDFNKRTKLEEQEYELIKEKNKMLAQQNEMQNNMEIKRAGGFANVILLSIITFACAIIMGLVIFNIFS